MRPKCQCPALFDRCLSMVKAGWRFQSEVDSLCDAGMASVNSCVESSTSAIWQGCSSLRLQPSSVSISTTQLSYDRLCKNAPLLQALLSPTSIARIYIPRQLVDSDSYRSRSPRSNSTGQLPPGRQSTNVSFFTNNHQRIFHLFSQVYVCAYHRFFESPEASFSSLST